MRADDGAELPDQAVEAEHLADPVGRRQAQEHEPIDHADTAEPGTQQRAGDQEWDRCQEYGDDHQADGPRGQHREERPARAPSIGEDAPPDRRDDRDDGEQQQDLERLGLLVSRRR